MFENKFYLWKQVLCEEVLDATKLYIWRISILDIPYKNVRSVTHFWLVPNFSVV